MNVYLEIILIFAIQLAEMLSFIGIGFYFFKLLGFKLQNFKLPVLPLILATLGIIAFTIVAALLNFIFPINHLVACGFILLGLIFFVKNKNFLSRILKYSIKPLIILTACIFALALCWGIQIADTFGYHILASKWVAESNMPVGQANLDIRLGYNSLIFTTYAITEFLMFKIDKPFFSFFPIFFSLFIYASFILLRKSLNKNNKTSFSDYYLISFFIIVFIYNRSFGSLATDLTSIIFAWLTFYFCALQSENNEKENKNDFSFIKLIIIFSVFTSTIKLSMAPICFLPILYIFINKNIRSKIIGSKDSSSRIKEFLMPLTIVLLLLITYITKGYLQSGYPAFPNSSFSIDVSWKVPTLIADEEREFICNFAKDYSHCRDKEYMKSLKWVPHWLIQFAIYERTLWITALMVLFLVYKNRSNIVFNKTQKTIILISIFGIIFVMYNAPAARFAHVFVYTALLSPMCIWASNNRYLNIDLSKYPKLPKILVILSILILTISVLFIYDNYFGTRIFHNSILKLFPATQTRSLPFVYAAFSICLVFTSLLSFFLVKKIKHFKENNQTSQILIPSSKIFLSIIIIASLSHISLEIPAIFGNHTRLRFPDLEKEISSTNGLTVYHYSPYICNRGLLATTYKHKVLAKKINGRYYFSFVF